jgi:DNA-binding GntR family transcriptional regulator
MGELFRRIKYLINRRRLDAELASDMEFHREMAARAGRSNFGNTLRMREQAREAWGWTWLDRLAQDLRYGVRILARAPGFTRDGGAGAGHRHRRQCLGLQLVST